MNIGFDHLVVWSAVIEIFLGRRIGLNNFSRGGFGSQKDFYDSHIK